MKKHIETDNQAVALIVDLGSHTIKAGCSTSGTAENLVEHVVRIPNIYGYQQLPGCFLKQQQYRSYEDIAGQKFSGLDAARRASQLSFRYPIEFGGLIQDYDAVEAMVSNAVEGLASKTANEYQMIMTTPPINTNSMLKQRQKLCEMAFEKLSLDSFSFSSSLENLLFSEGKQTGLVIDIGETGCYCGAVAEGYKVAESLKELNGVSGRHIVDKLARDFADKQNAYFTKSYDREYIVRDIKERCCWVSFPESEEELELQYTLPSGQTLFLDEQIQNSCPELIFSGTDGTYGIHNAVHDSLSSCPPDFQKEIAKNLVVAGGSTCFRNFDRRLLGELQQLNQHSKTSKNLEFELDSKPYLDPLLDTQRPPAERILKNWYGASTISQLSSFQKTMISKDHYFEKGAITIKV